jgi:Chaperone of endosialidase/YadA head domain repeat (2 copies)
MCDKRTWTISRGLMVILAIAGMAAILLPRGLAAQATVFYACYVPSSGTVYRIKEPDLPQQCGSSSKKGNTIQHVEFSWTDGGAAQGGVNDHGALTGLGDDDHAQYLLADGARPSVNGFAVDGTMYQGSIPASGPGTRFMWYPGKAAMRAGYVTGTQWDDANIGVASFAAGWNSSATGSLSIALGRADATGNGSIAIGGAALSSGTDAIALGRVAEATGTYSAALGELAKASGSSAIALGQWAVASGALSAALGNQSTASGYRSVAIGPGADTNGQYGAMVLSTAVPTTHSLHVKAVAQYQFVARAARFWFGNTENVTAPAGQLIATSTGAHLTVGGAWVNSSDVNRKANFAPVDGGEVLDRIAAMPIQTWNYRDEDESIRHMGPTAQDFRAAFALGENEISIATVDADGVSLAAIQALEQRTADLRRENASLRTTVESLGATMDDLRHANERLLAELRDLSARIDRTEHVRPDNNR